MRQLVVADLHYSLRQWDWVLRNAGRFDGVIIAGDLLDIVSTVDLDAQIVVILKYLARISRTTPRLLVTSGNHDLEAPDADGERTAAWLSQARASGVLVDGDTCSVGDWLISLCPWWESDSVRHSTEAQLAVDASRPRKHWMWIHHEPPHGSRTSWTGHADAGTPVLTSWIRHYKPDLVLSGHIHQAPFKEAGGWFDRIDGTWVFNAGCYGAAEPPFIVLDLDQGRAEWISAAGHEHVDLDLASRPTRVPGSPEVEADSPAPHPPFPGDPPVPDIAASNPRDSSSPN